MGLYLFTTFCATFILITYCSAAVVQPNVSNAKNLSAHPVVIVVSFDGFRHDYFEKTDRTPWLDALRKSGVSIPYMTPVFPTFTFPNHQSIATGMYVETHGIIDNYFYDPLYNKTLSGYTEDPGFWNYHPEVLPLWLRNEMAGEGRVSGCFMWPGSSQPYGVNDTLLPTYYRNYNSSIPWEHRVDTVISWITDDTKPANLVFMYFEEPDSHGHAFGPNSEETLYQVDMADNRTAYLVNKLNEAGIYEQVNLILLSDHGMQAVTQERIIYLDTMIDQNLIEAKHGRTPVLHLVSKEGRRDELYQKLISLSQNSNFTAWRKEELKSPYYFTESRRILDLVVIADPGYAFEDFDKNITDYNQQFSLKADPTHEYGVHGYSNMAESMRPFFIARGPAFRSGITHEAIRNVDIVPLISKILDITQPPTNGSIAMVQDMLQPPSLNSATTPRTISTTLSTNVTTPRTNVTTPRTNATTPRTNVTTPRTNATTPRTNVTTPRTNATTPRTNVTTPRTNVTTPRTNVTTPRTNVTTPRTNVTTPRTNVTTPRTNVTTPRTNVTTPRTNVTTPRTNVTTPRTNVTTPRTNVTTPLTNATTPRTNVTTPRTNSTVPPTITTTSSSAHFVRSSNMCAISMCLMYALYLLVITTKYFHFTLLAA